MPYLRGEDIVLGVAAEGTRGTAAEPQVWIPGRTPAGIRPVLEKAHIRETRGTKIATNASEITQKRAEGDLEFNLRVESIGFILKSLLGNVQSALKSGETEVFRHTFSVLPEDPEHPSLTLSLHKPGVQDYEYALALVASLGIEIVPDDVVKATVRFLAAGESEAADFTPSFIARDSFFRHQDATIKIAANVAGLATAPALSLKSFTFETANNARVDQNIAELNPGNVIALFFEPTGRLQLDLKNKALHDLFVAGTYRALRVTLKRTDITIGDASNPTIEITLPRISFEAWEPERPIDDVAREGLNFMAHYDATEAKALEVVVDNERENYNPES